MNKLWAAALLLLFGGCLPAPPEIVTREAVAVPAPVAAPELSPAAPLLDQAPSAAATLVAAADDPEVAGEAEPEADELALDPETLEDNLLLFGEDQVLPEEEGESVAPPVAFDFPVVENDKVRHYLSYFSGPVRKVFERWLERSGRYLPMMRQVFAEEGLPQDLAYLAMIESGFNNRAYSWAHAAGPWQFIESTGRIYGLDNDWWRDERRDPVKATRAAARHLKDLYAAFDGDWYLAVAAYNAGAGRVRRAVEQAGTRDFWQLSHGSLLAEETKNYLPKLLAAMLIAKEPGRYGFTELAYHDPLAYETVRVATATDLEVIADLCGSSYEEIKNLNPELKRWCTPPGVRNYEVRIPPGAGEGFAERYALVPEARRANYQRHRVQKGDTLGALARRYKIRTEDILALNGIRNPRSLRIGTDLILPLRQGYDSRVMAELGDDYQRTRRPAAAPRTYTVRKGDSLWQISRKLGVTEKELRTWNGLKAKSVLRSGQTLVVAGGKPAGGAGKQTAGGKQAPASRKIVYRVRQGDTLYAIARQFNVGTGDIMGWNNLRHGHVLHPGDRLTLLVGEDRRGG